MNRQWTVGKLLVFTSILIFSEGIFCETKEEIWFTQPLDVYHLRSFEWLCSVYSESKFLLYQEEKTTLETAFIPVQYCVDRSSSK